ncbi:MAG: hypothetical protein WCF90_07875 [Methanomicrobiales archaeon]
MDRDLDVGKYTVFQFIFKILLIGDKLVCCIETPLPSGKGDVFYPLMICTEIRYPSSAGSTWEIRNRFPVLYKDSGICSDGRGALLIVSPKQCALFVPFIASSRTIPITSSTGNYVLLYGKPTISKRGITSF